MAGSGLWRNASSWGSSLGVTGVYALLKLISSIHQGIAFSPYIPIVIRGKAKQSSPLNESILLFINVASPGVNLVAQIFSLG